MTEITYHRLDLYSSIAVLPVQTLPLGVSYVGVSPVSNSVLATVWVKSLDAGASVKITWFDWGPGSGSYPGEIIELAQHKIITTADTSDRRIVPKLHDKATAKIEITGGTAEVGIYTTAVSTFPIDPPFLNDQDANLLLDKGNANVVYDPIKNKWFFVQGQDGSQNVFVTGGSLSEPEYDLKIFWEKQEIVVNDLMVLIDKTVPTSKKWKVRSAKIVTRSYGYFEIFLGSDIIGAGLTSPAESNVKNDFFPYLTLNEGDNIKITFKTSYGPICDVSAFLQITET